jgi:hypothetical protein
VSGALSTAPPVWTRAIARAQRSAAQWRPRLVHERAEAWLRNMTGARRYRRLSEPEILATRKTDTLFIFGSGASINDLTPAEWAHIEACDTLSFNWFIHQHHVRADYHLVREVSPSDHDRRIWEPALREYGELIARNPKYADTVFLVQEGWPAVNGNRVIGLGALPHGARVFRFINRARDRYEPPSESFARGLSHSGNTLGDCVNFGFVMGWRRIVLVGVDMYDNRYFWLPADEMRASVTVAHPGLRVSAPFPSAQRVIDVFSRWRVYLNQRGVTQAVYNPKSLLAEAMPVYQADGRG